ncbi:MAG: hypothetical protein JRF59_17175 [Deltaproteobacteria bacterium]|nr:hypothetical protein [Deltaproteobacteria bacterium]MBW1951247.1 hypothetical protein [Deltaproteobacteria bacterium]MBW2349533.1 hypothetical protein [Deltaproteobacteria bacterium]
MIAIERRIKEAEKARQEAEAAARREAKARVQEAEKAARELGAVKVQGESDASE